MSQRLIIIGPGKGDIGEFYSSWGKVIRVLKVYLKSAGGYEMYSDFLSTGLPYHLPFSFDSSTASDFARDLIATGCEVQVVSA